MISIKRLFKYLRDKVALAFTGSTLFEVEWYPGNPQKGGLYRVPGHIPNKERYLLYRIWRTIIS